MHVRTALLYCSNEYPQYMLLAKIRNIMLTAVNPRLTRTVRGSDYRPAIALPEDIDIQGHNSF